jgi:uncharacterized protein (DUF983 family)
LTADNSRALIALENSECRIATNPFFFQIEFQPQQELNMNWVYLHLMTNHIPVILTGLGTLAVIVALVTKRRVVWLYALATLTLSGLSVYPVFLFGGQAGDIVEQHDKTLEKKVDEHDAAASFALASVLIAGAIAAYGWYRLTRPNALFLPVWYRVVVLLVALWAMSVVVRTALLGGEIRHLQWEISVTSS